MGSRWYVKHPTVPLKSVVAVLNGDMMGRNDPDRRRSSARCRRIATHRSWCRWRWPRTPRSPASPWTLVGRPAASRGLVLPQRSSALRPRRRAGAVLHDAAARRLSHAVRQSGSDRHREADKMTRWMYATGRAVADADKAPALDPAFKLERCTDYTGKYLLIPWTSPRRDRCGIDLPPAQDHPLVVRAGRLLEPRPRAPLDAPLALGPRAVPHRRAVDQAQIGMRRGLRRPARRPRSAALRDRGVVRQIEDRDADTRPAAPDRG